MERVNGAAQMNWPGPPMRAWCCASDIPRSRAAAAAANNTRAVCRGCVGWPGLAGCPPCGVSMLATNNDWENVATIFPTRHDGPGTIDSSSLTSLSNVKTTSPFLASSSFLRSWFASPLLLVPSLASFNNLGCHRSLHLTLFGLACFFPAFSASFISPHYQWEH
ncbi:hypothetical protein BKA80DRAFT_261243 [Phyllosticta citrichinensis]